MAIDTHTPVYEIYQH